MKRRYAQVLAVALGLSLAVAVQAQTRHDEKPHGTPKDVASAPKAKQVKQSGIAGRHDERPHGAPKQASPAGGGNK